MYLNEAINLADTMVRQRNRVMPWTWGQALFGYALNELDVYLGEDRYFFFTKSFCDYYVVHPPRVNSSDTSAPALITYGMYKRTGDIRYKHLTDLVLNYIRNEPRIINDAVNHLGNSLAGKPGNTYRESSATVLLSLIHI